MRWLRQGLAAVAGGIAAVGMLSLSGAELAALSRTKRVVERVSVSSAGAPANAAGAGRAIAMSDDGRLVCFDANATNLVAGDTNSKTDIFVRDRLLGSTERVSVANDGAQGNNDSLTPDISADGRFVVFESDATNLVPGDTNGFTDVFVRDRSTKTTSRVSVATGGAQGNEASFQPDISSDGRFVAFTSRASNLLASGADSNGFHDIFVRDLVNGTTIRVNVTSAGAQATGGHSGNPAISADGRVVAFLSDATNLALNDTNTIGDLFVRDQAAGTTERVNVSSTGQQAVGDAAAGPRISAGGRFVVYHTSASNLVSGDTNNAADVFLRDRVAGTTERVSVNSDGVGGSAGSLVAAMSADGMFIAFASSASNLVPSVPISSANIYVRSRATGETARADVSATGEAANAPAVLMCGISGNGRFVGFTSSATNLIPGDENAVSDFFVTSAVAVPGTRIAIFRPGSREWFARDDDGSTTSVAFGGPGDLPAPADYLGLGRAQVAIYRPSTGQWFLRSEAGGTLGPFEFGVPGAIPVPGDYLGTGRAQLAFFNPSEGSWAIRGEDPRLFLISFGRAGDVPVPADYLGLGKIQRAVFRPSTRQWFIADPRDAGVVVIEYGGPGDVPVPGDYFGIGRTSIAIFRPTTGEWYLRHDNGQTTRIPFGAAGDIPVAGDYLEQGRNQLAVFRPSTRSWLIRENNFTTTRIDFGGPGDQPLPVPFRARF